MIYTYLNIKGGVGKTSLSYNHAIEAEMDYITTDIVTTLEINGKNGFYKIPHNTKRIPKKYLNENCVFDLGAMSGLIDNRVTQAVELSDCVILPTLCDARSLEATVETFNFIRENARSIIIVINNYSKIEKFDYAYEYLKERLPDPTILDVRTTTLFERVAKDGITFLESVGHKRGEYQLKKTKESHADLYRAIETITKVRNAK